MKFVAFNVLTLEMIYRILFKTKLHLKCFVEILSMSIYVNLSQFMSIITINNMSKLKQYCKLDQFSFFCDLQLILELLILLDIHLIL